MAFSLEFQAHSEVGRVRNNNQDAGYASPNVLMVADGMGGAAAGDLASAIAATETSLADERLPTDELLDHIGLVIERTNEKLAELVEEDPTLDGMGTTFCGAMFSGSELGLAHIGDSRCYRLRGGELSQLTHDHSWVQALIDEGRITKEQAATHPHRSLILKVLNGQPTMVPDYVIIPVELGDRYLFCSDGLSGMISDARIQELMALPARGEAVRRLAEAANDAGGHDNITVVIGDVVERDEALDSAVAELVGSAVEREIPAKGVLAAAFLESTAPLHQDEDDDEDIETDITELARYAPDPGPKRRIPVGLAGIIAVLLVIGGAAWGSLAYANSRYFLADAKGSVAIYNGLPGSLLGRSLNTLVELPGIEVTDLPAFHQRAVQNTIGVSGLDEAHATADKLRVLAEQCVQAREERLNRPEPPPSPSPTSEPMPSGLSTFRPDYPTYLAPVTPTASWEADPEAC